MSLKEMTANNKFIGKVLALHAEWVENPEMESRKQNVIFTDDLLKKEFGWKRMIPDRVDGLICMMRQIGIPTRKAEHAGGIIVELTTKDLVGNWRQFINREPMASV